MEVQDSTAARSLLKLSSAKILVPEKRRIGVAENCGVYDRTYDEHLVRQRAEDLAGHSAALMDSGIAPAVVLPSARLLPNSVSSTDQSDDMYHDAIAELPAALDKQDGKVARAARDRQSLAWETNLERRIAALEKNEFQRSESFRVLAAKEKEMAVLQEKHEEHLQARMAELEGKEKELAGQEAKLQRLMVALEAEGAEMNKTSTAIASQREALASERKELDDRENIMKENLAALEGQRKKDQAASKEAAKREKELKAFKEDMDDRQKALEESKINLDKQMAKMKVELDAFKEKEAGLQAREKSLQDLLIAVGKREIDVQKRLLELSSQRDVDKATFLAATGSLAKRNNEIEAQENSLRKQLSSLGQREIALKSSAAQLSAQRDKDQATLLRANHALARKEEELGSREAALTTRQIGLEEREKRLCEGEATSAAVTRAAADKEKHLQALENSIGDQLPALNKEKKLLSEREETLAEQEKSISSRSAELDARTKMRDKRGLAGPNDGSSSLAIVGDVIAIDVETDSAARASKRRRMEKVVTTPLMAIDQHLPKTAPLKTLSIEPTMRSPPAAAQDRKGGFPVVASSQLAARSTGRFAKQKKW
jgi:chromosome segregation ATPase